MRARSHSQSLQSAQFHSQKLLKRTRLQEGAQTQACRGSGTEQREDWAAAVNRQQEGSRFCVLSTVLAAATDTQGDTVENSVCTGGGSCQHPIPSGDRAEGYTVSPPGETGERTQGLSGLFLQRGGSQLPLTFTPANTYSDVRGNTRIQETR